MLRKFVILVPICAGVLPGCMSAPPLSQASGTEHTNIMIKDVVQRIKCELSDAFDKKTEQRDFLWLASWTAHVDLTLQINDTAGIAPSSSHTDWRPNAIQGKGLPSVQQFFVLSAGANVSGQATRTETVSFTLALDELKRWRKQIDKMESAANYPLEKRICNFTPGSGVTGNLGLEEWVDSAFYPVETGDLQAGIHPAAGGGKASATQGPKQGPGPSVSKGLSTEKDNAEEIKNVKNWQAQLTALKSAIAPSNKAITDAATKIDQAKTQLKTEYEAAKPYGPVMMPYLKDRYRRVGDLMQQYAQNVRTCEQYETDIDNASKMASTILASIKTAGGESTVLSDDMLKLYDNQLEPLMTKKIGIGIVNGDVQNSAYVTGAAKCAKTLTAQATTASELPNVLPKEPDPPIDSVLHNLNFVLTYGANVTPSWTLIQWKGPGLNGPLASASGVRTHTLSIGLGPRTTQTAASGDALRLIMNQTIRSLAN